MSDLFSLEGQVAVVTGGAGLLGARFSRAFARQGASVAVADRDAKGARKVAAEIVREFGGKARGYALDLPKPASVRRLRAQVEKELGEASILINNAAAKSPNFFDRFEDYRLGDWNAVMDVNLSGAMVCAQAFGGAMARRGAGSIINVASIYGLVGPDQRIYEKSEYLGRPINTPAVYSASKAGLIGLTRYLAAYWGHRGVRVNALTPGGVESGQNQEFASRYGLRTPLGRMARKDELCGAALYLAGPAASYVTGHNLVVDGGWTAW